jgi:hypothetical protein
MVGVVAALASTPRFERAEQGEKRMPPETPPPADAPEWKKGPPPYDAQGACYVVVVEDNLELVSTVDGWIYDQTGRRYNGDMARSVKAHFHLPDCSGELTDG